MAPLLWWICCAVFLFGQEGLGFNLFQPLATVTNGTLAGLYLPSFNQDLFLGVPFASPPLGSLRLRHPVPYNESWSGVKDATKRAPSCPGYAGFDIGLELGEDCLTLDIVRPGLTKPGDNLPVLVWIYGGGFDAGGSADPRYNTSYLVQNSVDMHRPTILVSINYRVAGFGFLASKEVVDAGVANIGLFDQRLALRWLQENIGAFGGDPSKVTIWGESAGAFSVGYHLTGFDGKHDALFRAAILESGNALGPSVSSATQLESTYQPMYDNVTETVGCASAADTLECLREVPYEDLFKAFSPQVYTPIIDGVFITRLPSRAYAAGLVADVAILAGSNTDEGTATFFGPRGTLNNDTAVYDYISALGGGLNQSLVKTAMDLYPDDPTRGCPFNTGTERFADQGYQYKRGAAISGDSVIHAGRRYTTNYHSKHGRHAVYAYRFDQSPWNGEETLVATVAPVYSTHYVEICFVFDNPNNNTNWIGPYQSYRDLANVMSRSWISFAHDLNPNHHGVAEVPFWPEYNAGQNNIVFAAEKISVEKDDWRVPQLEFWADIWKELKT